MNGLSGAFGGVISFSAGYIRVGSMQSWKWIFIINGGITVLWAFVLFTFLPSGPLTAKFLKKEDQVLAIHRLSENKVGLTSGHADWQTGTRNATIKKYQIIEALDPRKDPQGILLCKSTRDPANVSLGRLFQ
jgi:MFS family permease